MTQPRRCWKCHTYVPRADRCTSCGCAAFYVGPPLMEPRGIALPVTFGGSREVDAIDSALRVAMPRIAQRSRPKGHGAL